MIKISTCTGSEDCLYPHTEIEKPVGVQERAPTHRLIIMLIIIIIISLTNRGGGCEGCGGGGGGGRHPVEEEPRVPVLRGLTLARHHLALLLLVVKPRTRHNVTDWLIKCSRTFYLSTGEELIISSRGSTTASDLLFLPVQEVVIIIMIIIIMIMIIMYYRPKSSNK